MSSHNRRGFTLIEMLIVIAIIAILVAIIVPIVSNASTKAKAAADAANLRSLQAEANALLVDNDIDTVRSIMENHNVVECRSDPRLQAAIYYRDPGFVYAYFFSGTGKYCGIDYFSDLAANGKTDVSTRMPDELNGLNVINVGIPGGNWSY